MTHLSAWVLTASASLALAAAACGDSSNPVDARPLPTDAGLDAPLPCGGCGANQFCVETWNGTCGLVSAVCVDKTATCDGTSCTPACDTAVCRGGQVDAGIFTCSAASCASESPGAFHCYGP